MDRWDGRSNIIAFAKEVANLPFTVGQRGWKCLLERKLFNTNPRTTSGFESVEGDRFHSPFLLHFSTIFFPSSVVAFVSTSFQAVEGYTNRFFLRGYRLPIFIATRSACFAYTFRPNRSNTLDCSRFSENASAITGYDLPNFPRQNFDVHLMRGTRERSTRLLNRSRASDTIYREFNYTTSLLLFCFAPTIWNINFPDGFPVDRRSRVLFYSIITTDGDVILILRRIAVNWRHRALHKIIC